jgi:hypothetical protein
MLVSCQRCLCRVDVGFLGNQLPYFLGLHLWCRIACLCLQENRGLLSSLIEEEVGLWTTDIGDEQITSAQVCLLDFYIPPLTTSVMDQNSASIMTSEQSRRPVSMVVSPKHC